VVEILIPFIILFGFIILLFLLKRRMRGSGAGLFMVISGATDAFYDKDRKKSIEMIVEKNAHKKMDEQSSSEDVD